MSIARDGQVYFRTTEACRKAGVSSATLFRWINDGLIADAGLKDRNGWRLFTVEDIAAIRSRAMQCTETEDYEQERRNQKESD